MIRNVMRKAKQIIKEAAFIKKCESQINGSYKRFYTKREDYRWVQS
jgi:hypothetical protein